MKGVRDHHRENPSDKKRTEAPLLKAALLDVRPNIPAFDYAAMCFDDVKLVQMVRFKSRSKLLNGHIVVNDFGAFLL